MVSAMGVEKVAVYIWRDLYERVRREVEGSGGEFESVEGYVEFILEEILKGDEEEQVYSKEEEIKKRLRALGYIA